jgi:hypothetical protein
MLLQAAISTAPPSYCCSTWHEACVCVRACVRGTLSLSLSLSLALSLSLSLSLSPGEQGGLRIPTHSYEGLELDHKVSGAVPGAVYGCAVRASNALGGGEVSAVAQCTVKAGVPNAPPPPTLAQRTSETLLLRWGSPAGNGAAVESFQVEMDRGDGRGMWAAESGLAEPAYLASGLLPGRSYAFRVSARNREGASQWTAPTSFTTATRPAATPRAAPWLAGGGHAGRTAATLCWGASEDDGGAPVQGYVLTVREAEAAQASTGEMGGAGRQESGGRSAKAGRKRKGGGQGRKGPQGGEQPPPSSQSAKAVAASSPGWSTVVQTAVATTSGGGGGGGGGGSSAALALLSARVEELRPGVAYLASVQARNEAGLSAAGPALRFTSKADVPSRPAPPRVRQQQQQPPPPQSGSGGGGRGTKAKARSNKAQHAVVLVEWQAPTHDHGAPITEYDLQQGTDTDGTDTGTAHDSQAADEGEQGPDGDGGDHAFVTVRDCWICYWYPCRLWRIGLRAVAVADWLLASLLGSASSSSSSSSVDPTIRLVWP